MKVEPDRSGDGIWYCRHDAFQHAFLRINDGWHLVITPHYVFTTDGRTPHPHGEELLSGLKRQEHQKAVLGQVVMWRYKLTEQRGQMRLGEGEREQPLIGFGDLTRFSCPRGINDADWLWSAAIYVARNVCILNSLLNYQFSPIIIISICPRCKSFVILF